MPDRMPNRMSEDMSDRMPEDVPVRTCINVMVGITRSKVILTALDLITDCNCVNFWSHQLLSDLADFRDGVVISSFQMLSHPADT